MQDLDKCHTYLEYYLVPLIPENVLHCKYCHFMVCQGLSNSKDGQTDARELNKSQRDKTFFCNHDVVSLVDLGAKFFLWSWSSLSMYFLYLYQNIQLFIWSINIDPPGQEWMMVTAWLWVETDSFNCVVTQVLFSESYLQMSALVVFPSCPPVIWMKIWHNKFDD